MKKHLLSLKRMRAGTYRDISSGLFLDRNERVVPYDPAILEKLSQRLAQVPMNLYPELKPFYRKLSAWLGLAEGQIYVTEGVSGAVKALIETIGEEGQNIVFPTPTFALYPVYCDMFELEYRTVGYTEDYKLDVKGLLNQIDENTAIVFLPNPNMPIEGTQSLKELSTIAIHCKQKGAYLAVDEVYYPYGGPTAQNLISQFDNLFVMRSFSKAFGLAGIRVGFVLGTKENIDYVSKMRTGYETNTLSIEVANFFIDHFDLVETYIQSVKEGFVYLKGELDKLGLEYAGGNTGNFMFVNLNDETLAKKIVEDLRHNDIYIRGGWPVPYEKGFSITGAPKDLMSQFVNAFSPLWADRLQK